MLQIAQELRDEILDAASAAFPNECCGLIEGFAKAGAWHAVAVHPARNLADNPANRFLIDPQVHFDLLRRLRGSERGIIGCFHSHPKGPPSPSDNDREMAIERNFVWLIASGEKANAFVLRAFVFHEQGDDFSPLDLHP